MRRAIGRGAKSAPSAPVRCLALCKPLALLLHVRVFYRHAFALDHIDYIEDDLPERWLVGFARVLRVRSARDQSRHSVEHNA